MLYNEFTVKFFSDLLKKSYLIFFSLFLSSALTAFADVAESSVPDGSLTLRQAYELSLKRSEDIASKAEVIREAEGHFYQALSGILPNVDFVMTRFDQDASGSSSSDGSGATSNLLRRSTPVRKFKVSQPLFSGFKELAAMQGAGAEKSQRIYEKKRAEELLFIDITEAYYGLLEARKDLELLDKIQALLNRRIATLSERVRIGRSRESESKTALVDLKLAEVEKEDSRQAEIVWRRLLEFYIGREIRGPLEDDAIPGTPLADTLETSAKAGKRSDVAAAKEAYNLSDKKVGVATSGLFPTLSVDGNYYTQRVGIQSGIDWDVLFTVDVPIFEGTRVVGDIKSAAAQRESAKLTWSKLERQARLEAEDAFDAYQSSLRQENALLEAMHAAEDSAKLYAEEYEHNLVNNLDVLQTLKAQEDTSRRWNQAHYQAKKNYWKFKVAAGEALGINSVEP